MPDAAFIDLQHATAEYSIVALGIVLEAGSSAAPGRSGLLQRNQRSRPQLVQILRVQCPRTMSARGRWP
jgi:hypothetical protein